MAIEFPCAKCGQLVRTPDSAAGRKGKCPSCGQVQRIPGGDTPSPTAEVVPPTPAAQKPSIPTPKPPAKPAHPTASTPPKDRPKSAPSKLIIPDPPSLTPTQPAPTPPSKLPEPKLNTPTNPPGKAASQWTSYVKRGAESIRPTPMPPADPRIAPRPPAQIQVLPPLEPVAKLPTDAMPPRSLKPDSIEQRTADDSQQRRQLLDKLTPPSTPTKPPEVPSAAAEPATPGSPGTAVKFDFACPHCGSENRASQATAGKKGRCPHCQAIIQIPALPAALAPTATTAHLTPAQFPTPASPALPIPDNPATASDVPAAAETSSKTNPIAPGRKWATTPERPAEIPSLTPIPADEEDLPELTPLTPEQIAQLIALEAAQAAETAPALTPLGPVGRPPQ